RHRADLIGKSAQAPHISSGSCANRGSRSCAVGQSQRAAEGRSHRPSWQSWQTNHVGSGPSKDRGFTAGTVGEDQGWQEVGARVSGLVDAATKRAIEFGNRIEELVLTKGQAPTGDRNTLLIAY